MAFVRECFRESLASLEPGTFPHPMFIYGNGRTKPRVEIVVPGARAGDSLADMARSRMAPLLRKEKAGLLAVALTAQVARPLTTEECEASPAAVKYEDGAFEYDEALPTIAIIVAIDRYGQRFETSPFLVRQGEQPRLGAFSPATDENLDPLARALRRGLVAAGIA